MKLPGPKSGRILSRMKKVNGGWCLPLPFVYAGGDGCYFKDIDGNRYLDFASQIASNPLGYNHKAMNEVLRRYKRAPAKIAGQDFTASGHLELIEELLKISPRGMDAAFLSNSGAEAVENAMKIAMRRKKGVYGISFEHAFHGRTLGALSCTNSKIVQKAGYWAFPMHRLPFDDDAPGALEDTIKREGGAENVSFVIVEAVQGEGGYNIATQRMLRGVREVTRNSGVPLICDEVQSGLGRTGKWWAFEHYGIVPEAYASAKALQVGATVAAKSFFPKEPSAISSTWGGGSLIDMAMALATIRTIKKDKLLQNCTKMGAYLLKGLRGLADENEAVSNPRGLGLMAAFDLADKNTRDHFAEHALESGLAVLGAGRRSVRLIPPYIVKKGEIDEALTLMASTLKAVGRETRPRGLSHAEHAI